MFVEDFGDTFTAVELVTRSKTPFLMPRSSKEAWEEDVLQLADGSVKVHGDSKCC